MAHIQVATFVASNRTGSINRKLAAAIQRLAPSSMQFIEVDMYQMPFYNGDLEAARPEAVNDFTRQVSSCDAQLFVTPEFNRSIPGVLKNAIDWGSKPINANIWREKPAAMTGASPGAIGTAVGQQHLRQILSINGSYVLPGETYISFKSPEMIDDDGMINDESVHTFVAGFVERFSKFAERFA